MTCVSTIQIIFTERLPCAQPVLGDARAVSVIETAPQPCPLWVRYVLGGDRAVPDGGIPEWAGLEWGILEGRGTPEDKPD